MPSYDSLSTQITAVKNEIDSSLAASNYSAQDLVFIAKAQGQPQFLTLKAELRLIRCY